VVDQLRVVNSAPQLTLPLDAYSLNKHDYLLIQKAAWKAIGDCAARFGVAYSAAEPSGVGLPPLSGENGRRYFITSLDEAASHGYRYGPGVQGSSTGNGGKGGSWTPTATELLIIRGAPAGQRPPLDSAGMALPPGGCSAEGNTKVFGNAQSLDSEGLPGTLANDSWNRSSRDSRVVAAESRWSACMGQQGYSFATSRDANNFAWPNPVGAAERATATADVKCKFLSNLIGIWWSVEIAYQRRSLDVNAVALKKVQDFNASQVKAATSALAG
jgi:hypothetical protein